MNEFRILVCGGRAYNDQERVNRVLDAAARAMAGRHITIIHGDSTGADRCADIWATFRENTTIKAYPADWATHGKKAGPIRNKQMLDEGKPDAVIAFPGGTGTRHMVILAKRYGIPVKEYFE